MARWINAPKDWTEDGGVLRLTTEPDTDFWNVTHYGFTHDNGHFRGHTAEGDFSAVTNVRADYSALYDQAGLMVFVDADNWMKAGIEHTDGAPHFSVVVTRDGRSDWSQLPFGHLDADGLTVRVTRHGEALRVQYVDAQGKWAMARLAYLAMGSSVEIGPMACAPTGPGFEVTFDGFEIGPAISPNLHGD